MLNRDFREFVECLSAEGVEYLLIGGYALADFKANKRASGRFKDLADLELLGDRQDPSSAT